MLLHYLTTYTYNYKEELGDTVKLGAVLLAESESDRVSLLLANQKHCLPVTF